jgi:RHS repeat-associated protein
LNFTENDVNYTTYTYGNVYRLTNVSYPDGSWTAYIYDGVGNRLTMKTSSSTTSYTYDEDNRILTAGSITYEHDENGNLINRTDGNNITLYEYDYDNRLTKVTLPNSNTVIYQYAANGDRLNKTSSTGTTLYLYDGDNILMELDENGNKTAFYAYGPNIDEPIFMVISGASYYYHADHLGSIRVLTDANEDIVATYQYDAFGTILQETGDISNPYRFTGREWDVESGLYYYRARYYNAIMGRFLQKDPQGMVDGPNLYVYVRNNPVNFKDPMGKEMRMIYHCVFWVYLCYPSMICWWEWFTFKCKIKYECRWYCLEWELQWFLFGSS